MGKHTRSISRDSAIIRKVLSFLADNAKVTEKAPEDTAAEADEEKAPEDEAAELDDEKAPEDAAAEANEEKASDNE